MLRSFRRAGVDVLSYGGTKNGAMLGEAIVVLNPEASEGLTYLRKMDMQLASKMRFVSAQLLALLDGDMWWRNATHSNAMAQRLRAVFAFYDWDAAKNEVRWMCSFDTSEDDIDLFLAAIARETSAT